MKIEEEFLRELYDVVDSHSKNRIEKEFPQLFKLAKVGDWVKKGLSLWFIEEVREVGTTKINNVKSYGFDKKGEWTDSMWRSGVLLKREKATLKEVEEALMAEFKKRGYKEGSKLGYIKGNSSERTIGSLSQGFIYNDKTDQLLIISGGENGGGLVIYRDGQWADIIEEPKTELTQDNLEEFNSKVEQFNSKVDALQEFINELRKV